MALDSVLMIGGLALEAALVAVLLYRRTWGRMPAFCVYAAWLLLSDAALVFSILILHRSVLKILVMDSVVDAGLRGMLFTELWWKLLRRYRRDIRPFAIFVVGVALVLAGLLLWPLAGTALTIYFLGLSRFAEHLSQDVSLVTAACAVVLVITAKALDIRWTGLEYRAAVGFGLFSMVSFATAVVTGRTVLPVELAHRFDQGVSVCFAGLMVYWIVGFWNGRQHGRA
jgi:hypothetical protein